MSDLSENRVSFTNDNLHGYAGYLVEFLGDSDNGEQNELDGIDTMIIVKGVYRYYC